MRETEDIWQRERECGRMAGGERERMREREEEREKKRGRGKRERDGERKRRDMMRLFV